MLGFSLVVALEIDRAHCYPSACNFIKIPFTLPQDPVTGPLDSGMYNAEVAYACSLAIKEVYAPLQ
jgi:hypothetical protein